ncbi:MAG: hypothetical protein U0359_32195 [Byssovorax sp.]
MRPEPEFFQPVHEHFLLFSFYGRLEQVADLVGAEPLVRQAKIAQQGDERIVRVGRGERGVDGRLHASDLGEEALVVARHRERPEHPAYRRP